MVFDIVLDTNKLHLESLWEECSNIGTPSELNIKHQTSVSSTLFRIIYSRSPFTALSGHVHAVNKEWPSHRAEH